ncbi:MAG: glycoside hydrolase family 3 C-terminal domain-containing protein [Lachnospiraceae bacterium]|nr:glycoside hydrolase family 3 C-terminal domain-containing protein [Lachnospiraceae bacterium]
MGRWMRALYTPVLPLGEDNKMVTGSKEHIELSKKAATEGMVLLKNENKVLPLEMGTKVALFGKASADYVRGGGGSGEVTVKYNRTLIQGMRIKEDEGKVSLYEPLNAYYENYVKGRYEEGDLPGLVVEPELSDDLLNKAKDFADVAVVSISRFSGEGWDRKTDLSDERAKALHPRILKQLTLSAKIFEDGDFYLTAAESKMLGAVKSAFKKVVVVLNVGGMFDTTFFKDDKAVSSVLLGWQAGMEGGLAEADILVGDVNPSGKLTDTFAASLEDYPSSYNFHESPDYCDYTDDIYVGYRYFETIPGASKKVNYPFGYGLSYTDFDITIEKTSVHERKAEIIAKVKNTGCVCGKEVVQVYISAPQGILKKPNKTLCAFKKTKALAPGECEALVLSFDLDDFASYDDTGKIKESAYILEKGEYVFFVGNSVENVKKTDVTITLESDVIVKEFKKRSAPHKLNKRLLSDGTYEELHMDSFVAPQTELGEYEETLEGMQPEVVGRKRRNRNLDFNPEVPQFIDVAEGRMSLEDFLEALPVEALIHILGGQPNTGVANTYGFGNLFEYGVPNIMTADGPAGLRIDPKVGTASTAFPCATLLACTWNEDIVCEVGKAAASEVKENNLCVWLAPAMNIHRSPLCGRNFEYYSEDPFVSGKIGAAMVKGIQSMNIGASVKHFCANNKETNRKSSDSRVSERALREIYLKGFEIVVKEADPWTIMSSYNIVNGVRASESYDLLTGILREEWGFKGLVTSDWWNYSEHYLEIKAGNDIKMGTGYPERVKEAYDKGLITKDEIKTCARRVLELILKID